MQFEENGKFTGYQVEIMEAIFKRVGLTPVYSLDPQPEMFDALREKKTDMALDLMPTAERRSHLLFSENTYDVYMAIFGQKNRTDLDSIDALKDKVIASYKGYGFETKLKRHLPEARIVRADDTQGMFRLVASGQADAAVHGIASGEFMLQKNLIANVVSHGEFLADGEKRLKVSQYIVRKDLPHLMSILDKAYASISESKKQAIWNRWFVGKTPKTEESILALTPEERAWLKAHPEINLGYTDSFEPLLIASDDGTFSGVYVDILEIMNKRLGTNIGLRIGSVPKILQQAKTKEIDGLLSLHPDNAAKLGLLATVGYKNTYPAVFARREANFKGPANFAGKKVAIIDKVYFSEAIIQQYGGEADIVRVASAPEGLRKVQNGSVDLFVGMASDSFTLQKYRLVELASKYTFFDYTAKFGYAVRSDWPELVSILNKGILSFSENEIEAIFAKWFQLPVKKKMVSLTAEEKAWLDRNQKVRVRVADWPPYLIVEDNQPPQGIAIEYLKLIGERTGITFTYEVTDRPFVEFLQDITQHQGPDMSALIMPTPEREQYLSFSQAYIAAPYVIFTREQDDLILDISGLTGKTVAVPRGFTVQERLTRDFPAIRLSLFDSDAQALQAVATLQADAYIGSLTVASHIIQRDGLSGLRVSAPSPFGDQRLSMGNRKDWPELTSMINKALASISEAEKAAIRSKYVALRYEPGINRAYALKWFLIVGGTTFSILLLILFWNRSLVKMVRARTAELESSNKSLAVEVAQRAEAEKLLRESRDYLQNLTDSLPDAVFSVKMPERTIEWASDTFNVLGYEPGECVGKTTEFFYPSKEDFFAFGNEIGHGIAEGKELLHFEQTLRTKSGELFPAESTVSLFKTDENVVSATATVRNIAERKQAEQKLQEYQHRLKSLAS